ncbi:MAG: condensation domain-containing protein [Clostridiaceae bacterium]|nr:condensation domain-containing protein [Clostridiaceae bacterium]
MMETPIAALRKLYPLTPSQKLVFLSWQYTLHKQITNIPSSFFVDTPLDLSLMKKAAEEAIQRNDSFGLRITRQGKNRLQYYTEKKVLVLEIKDFSGKSEQEMETFFYKTGRKKMPMYDQPLAKIYIVKAPDGSCGVFSCICHLAMDFWAICMFYRDILSLYLAYQNQAPMPKPIRSSEILLQKEMDYQESDRYLKDKEFWRQELQIYETPPIFTHINGSIMLDHYRRLIRKPGYRFCKAFFFRTTAKHEVFTIEKEDVERMRDFCIQNSLPSMQILMIMGLRTFLTRVNNRESDISFYSIISRRSTLEEKAAGGTRAQTIPFRSVLKEELSFKDALNALIEKQNTLYRHADFDTMEIFNLEHKLYNMKQTEGYCSMPITFQPIPIDPGNGMKIKTKWYCTGAAATSVYITILDGDNTGALRFYYEYMDKIIKKETVVRCHKFIMKTIMTGIADPAVTIKALLDAPV